LEELVENDSLQELLTVGRSEKEADNVADADVDRDPERDSETVVLPENVSVDVICKVREGLNVSD